MRCEKCKMETDAVDYVGKLVFVEAHRGDKTDKEYSNYGGGEYLVIRQSPNVLYCVNISSTGVYAGREVRQFSLIGQNRWDVLESSVPKRADIERFVRELWESGHAPERGEKLQWVEYVYSEAKATARQLAAAFDISLPPTTVTVSSARLDKLEATVKILTEKLKVLGAGL